MKATLLFTKTKDFCMWNSEPEANNLRLYDRIWISIKIYAAVHS